MDNDRSRFGLFLAEARRRHLWRAAIAYGASAFVLLQAGEIVLPAFGAPDWALRVLVVLALLGFPPVLVLAWVYEITPHGIARTQDLQLQKNQPGSLMPRLAFLAVTVVSVAVAGWWLIDTTVRYEPPAGESSLAAAPTPSDRLAIRSLAVLPFENFAEEGGQDYFSAGMHEAVIAQLSQIASLRVVSRTTAMQYAGTTKTVPQVARELGVDAIVEGSVLRAEDRVRITVQLIHGASDHHLWTNSYERDFTNVIALQAEVAQAIAREIQAELTPEEETRLAQVTRVEPAAHEAYLQGRFLQSQGTPEALREAVEYYRLALNEDSSYAPAFEALAGTQLLLDTTEPDTSPERLSSALDAAVHALTLDQNSAEARAILAEAQKRIVHLSDSLGHDISVKVELDSLAMPSPEWVTMFTDFGRKMEEMTIVQRAEGWAAAPLSRQVIAARRLALHGRSDHATELLRELLAEDPSQEDAWDALEHGYAVAGEIDEAVGVRRERVIALGGGAPELARVDRLERAVAKDGARGYWGWRLQDLRSREAAGERVSHVDRAAALVGTGHAEGALEQLQRASEVEDPKLYALPVDPIWDPIRGDPRFRELVMDLRRPPRPGVPTRR